MVKQMRISMGILCIVLALLCLGRCNRDPAETEEAKEYTTSLTRLVSSIQSAAVPESGKNPEGAAEP